MNLKQLQEELFKMLVFFDEICKKENISYYLDSGTAIGAVREHDFIPWDDDIDVAITRNEYEKLRLVLPNYLPSHMRFIEPSDYEPLFLDFYPRIINLNLPLRPETEEDRQYHNYQNRASIDFIILDNAPNSKLLQKIMLFKCKAIYGMCMSKRYELNDTNYTPLEKILSKICIQIGCFFSTKQLINLYKKNVTSYSHKKTQFYIRSNTILYLMRFHPQEHFKGTVYLNFHGKDFPLPAQYHFILTEIYGDYMTPSKNYKGFKAHADYSTSGKKDTSK